MTTALLRQDAHAVFVSNTLRFQLVSYIDALGTPPRLPRKEVFIHKIGVYADPKSDTFLRVATLFDLTTTTLADVRPRSGEYRSAQATVWYDDIEAATAAKQLIQVKLNKLIADYDTYLNAFQSPDEIELPTINADLLQTRKDAYTAAKLATANAIVARSDAIRARQDAEAAAGRASAAHTRALEENSACGHLTQLLAQGVDGLVAAVADATTFRTASETFSALTMYTEWTVGDPPNESDEPNYAAWKSALATYASDLRTATAKLGYLTDAQTTLNAGCASKASAVINAAAEKTAADAAVASALTEEASARAAATAATLVENTALAAVTEVCPSFVP